MKALALILSLLVLSACIDDVLLPPTTTAAAPEVTELHRVVEVRYKPGNSAIGPRERVEIERALARSAASRRLPVTILAGGDTLSRIRAEALAEIVVDTGFAVRIEDGRDLASDSLRVVFTRVAVNAPGGCPGWKRDRSFADSFVNGVRPGHGCATAGNLAAMLEDPQDMVRARSATTWRVDRATRALADFDTGAEQVLPAISLGPIGGE